MIMAKEGQNKIQLRLRQPINSEVVRTFVRSVEMDDGSPGKIRFQIMPEIVAVSQDVADVETDGEPELIHHVLDPFEWISERFDGDSPRFHSTDQNLL